MSKFVSRCIILIAVSLLFVDGKSIGQERNIIHPLSSLLSCTVGFDNEIGKKLNNDSVLIIGLGEFSHGSHEPIAFKAELIKCLVTKANVRQILFEFPNVLLFELNNYLNDPENKDTSLTKGIIDRGFGQAERDTSFFEFIRWLKSYNMAQPQRTVTLRGIDVNGEAESFFSFFINAILIHLDKRYAEQLISESKTMPLDSLVNSEVDWIEKKKSLLLDAIGTSQYEKLMNEVTMVKYALRHLQLQKVNAFTAAKYRDSIMSENVAAFANVKSVIWAHNMHITTSSTSISMGNYLENEFGGGYVNILTDFANEASVSIPSGYKKYDLKNYKSDKRSVAIILSKKFNASEGVVLFSELKTLGIKPVYNEIDAFGNYRTVGQGVPFDILIFFDKATPLKLY